MVHENPALRPSASTLVHHPCICPDSIKSKAQLRKELRNRNKELEQEKLKNERLQRKVQIYEEQIHKLDSPLSGSGSMLSTSRVSVVEGFASSSSNNNNTNTINKTNSNKLPRSLSSTII